MSLFLFRILCLVKYRLISWGSLKIKGAQSDIINSCSICIFITVIISLYNSYDVARKKVIQTKGLDLSFVYLLQSLISAVIHETFFSTIQSIDSAALICLIMQLLLKVSIRPLSNYQKNLWNFTILSSTYAFTSKATTVDCVRLGCDGRSWEWMLQE